MTHHLTAEQREEIKILRARISELEAEIARLKSAPDDCPEFGAAPCASMSADEEE